MSLINKMLSDLEERHSYHRDQNDISFDGLAPVADTGFSSVQVPYNFLLVCFFLLAVSVAVYAYLPDRSIEPADTYAMPQQMEPTRVPVLSTGIVTDEAVTASTVETQILPVSLSPDLKLDMSLPLQASVNKVTATSAITALRAISLIDEQETSSLHLQFDQRAEFKVYTLHNPDRVVLDIENTLLRSTLPVVAEHSLIQNLRYSSRGDDTLRLVADLRQPVLIDDTVMASVPDGYTLSIRLIPEQSLSMQKPLIVTEMIREPVIEESVHGQMEVKPSPVSPAIVADRLFAESRVLYAERNFRRGDEKILAALGQQPLHIEARSLYASSLINRGNIPAAMQVLDAGLQINPGVSEWARFQAQLLANQGHTDKAIEVLAKALPDSRIDPDYYALYAALLQRVSRHQEAAEQYRTLLSTVPEKALWWMGLAISLDAMRDSAGALSAYNRSLQGDGLNFELRQYVMQQIERLTG